MTTHWAMDLAARRTRLLFALLFLGSLFSGCNNQDSQTRAGVPTVEVDRHFTPIAAGMQPPEEQPMPASAELQPAQGQWGGDHISATFERDGVQIQFDCARASIESTAPAKSLRGFNASGTLSLNAASPNPAPRDEDLSASFVATIAPEIMNLRVIYEYRGEMRTEDYLLERNRQPAFFDCPQ